MKLIRLFHVLVVLLVSGITLVAGVLYSTPTFKENDRLHEAPVMVAGPDVIIGNLFGLAQFGSNGTQVGLAMGTEVCNAGAVDTDWFASPSNHHPVVPQNLYRMSGGASNDERFEQIGQSSLLHGFFALAQNSCGFGCNGVSGNHLGSGCSNSDSPAYNAGPNLGSRAWINPFTGAYPSIPNANDHSGHTHNGVSHRLLVEMDDLNTSLNQGATYYAEAQYITPHEGTWCQSRGGECNMYNNVSYRRFNVTGTSSFNFSPVGSTVQTQPAIYAWPGAAHVQFEPDPRNDGIGVIAYKVTSPSPDVWHYEYAIYNENLDRAIQFFAIPVGTNVALTDIGFHSPPQHQGWSADGTVGNAGFSNMPWIETQGDGFLTWSSETFLQNPNANAIRWGTMYNFRFDSDKPPQNVNATVGFFKNGEPISVAVQGPGVAPSVAINGTVTYGNAIGEPNPRFVSDAIVCSSTGSPAVLTTTSGPGPTEGQYTLTGFGSGAYTIVAAKSGGANNITSFDAAKVAQHVAGISQLTGNQLLVADVSDNGSVSSFDAAEIARYVTATPSYGFTGTWRFLPTSKSYNSVVGNISGEDYSGLLMGEVSGNWTNTVGRPLDDRQSAIGTGLDRTATVELPHLVTPVNKQVIVPVNVKGVANKEIIAYEFDLRYDPSVIIPQVDPVDLTRSASRGLTFMVNTQETGLLRVAVYGAVPIDGDGVLLNLRFMAVGASGSSSPLTFERFMFNEDELGTRPFEGQVALSDKATIYR